MSPRQGGRESPLRSRFKRAASLRTWIVLGISVLAPATIALAGLVIQDALPVAGRSGVSSGAPSDPSPLWDAKRLALLVLGILLLWLLLTSRRVVERHEGTLYYIQYLFESMSNWHVERLQTHQERSLDARVITRWVRHPYRPRGDPHPGFIDMVDDIDGLRVELQRCMNDDSSDTGFNVAPNLLWPAAMALGYELYLWPDLVLEDFGAGDDAAPVTWRLGSAEHRLQRNAWRARLSRGKRDFDTPAVASDHGHEPVRRVLVSCSLTVREGIEPVTQWTWGARYNVSVPRAPGDTSVGAARQPVRVDTRPWRQSTGDALVHPWAAVESCAAAIRAALHDHPQASVAVAARVTKSVALAIGWRLANGGSFVRGSDGAFQTDPGCGNPGCRNESCLHPWSRLVLLLRDQEFERGYLVTRVHRDQPDCVTLLTLMTEVDESADVGQ